MPVIISKQITQIDHVYRKPWLELKYTLHRIYVSDSKEGYLTIYQAEDDPEGYYATYSAISHGSISFLAAPLVPLVNKSEFETQFAIPSPLLVFLFPLTTKK